MKFRLKTKQKSSSKPNSIKQTSVFGQLLKSIDLHLSLSFMPRLVEVRFVNILRTEIKINTTDLSFCNFGVFNLFFSSREKGEEPKN